MPDNQTVQIAFHVPGTLAADLAIRWTSPFDAQLIHVSAVGSNAYAAGLSIGTSADATAFLSKSSIGVSGTPVEFGFDDFVAYASRAYPRITAGTIVALAVDYDYNGGGSSNASANVTLVLTLLKG